MDGATVRFHWRQSVTNRPLPRLETHDGYRDVFLVTSVFHRRCKKRSVINNVSCRIQLIQWKVERMLPCGDDALWSVNSDLPVTSDSDFQMHWRIQKNFAVMWKSTVASISRQNNSPKVLPQEDRMAHPGARCRHDGTPWRQSPSCWRISGRRASDARDNDGPSQPMAKSMTPGMFQKSCSSTSLKSTFVLHNILVFKFWGRQIHQSHLIPTMVSLRQFADLMHRFQSNQHVFSAIRQENLHPPSTGRIFWKVTTQWLSSTCGVGGNCATTVGALRRVMPIANWAPCRKSRPEATTSISRSWCIIGTSSQPDICVRKQVERIRGPVRLWFSLCRCWSTELQVQRSDSSEHSPAAAKARTASSIVIESVRTPEPMVQGQGISPDCDFASRSATKEQSPFRCQPATGPTRSKTLQRASHSLITRADRTNGREMLCAPELHQTTKTRGFSNAPLPCLQCFCSVPKRATVHAWTRQWSVRTHGCNIIQCDKCNNSVIICTCMYKCSVAWMAKHIQKQFPQVKFWKWSNFCEKIKILDNYNEKNSLTSDETLLQRWHNPWQEAN